MANTVVIGGGSIPISGTITGNITQWASTTLGAPTAFGTGPSGNVIGVNAELFVGSSAVSATAPVPISATAAANGSGNPIFVEAISGSTTAVTQSTAASLNATVVGTGTFAVQSTSVPATSGGLSVATGSISATATAVKAGAGQLYGWYIFNSNSTTVYCQLFNTASGSVTLGMTAPFLSFGIPAGAAANILSSMGIAFSTAITVAFTTTRAGSTPPSNAVDYNFFYD